MCGETAQWWQSYYVGFQSQHMCSLFSWFLDSKTVSGVSSNWEAEGMCWGWPGVLSENLMTAECMVAQHFSPAGAAAVFCEHIQHLCVSWHPVLPLFARLSLSHVMHCDGFARGISCSV